MLNGILEDIFGDRRLIRSGILPLEMLAGPWYGKERGTDSQQSCVLSHRF
jgi:uncharacterized circularly permuted ATP-grasp superfamily protein